MSATPITITLDVPAADAIAAGVDRYGQYQIEVRPSELSEGARAYLAAWAKGHRNIKVPVPVEPTTESVRDWLEASARAIEASQAVEAAQREAQIQQALSTPDAEWISGNGKRKYSTALDGKGYAQYGIEKREPAVNEYPSSVYLNGVQRADPRIVARRKAVEAGPVYAEAMGEFERHLAAWQAYCEQCKREEAAQAEEVRKAAARRDDQIKTWLATRAPEAMRKRAARGLLPEDEVIAGMREEAFAPLAELPRLQRLTDDEVRQALDPEGYGSAPVKYGTRDAESANDGDIALMERIERLLPTAKTSLIEHVGYLAGASGEDDPELVRRAVRVELTMGELRFTREYAAHLA